MRIFKNRWFAKFAKDEKIDDARLCQAVQETEKGLIDADYGGRVIKQRVARPNEGKSGGYRTIVLYLQGDKAFFVYGFAKNERDNISSVEVREFKTYTKELFLLSDDNLNKLITTGALTPIDCYEKRHKESSDV